MPFVAELTDLLYTIVRPLSLFLPTRIPKMILRKINTLTMLKRIIPLFLLTFSLFQLQAQTPEKATSLAGESLLACSPTENADAGTSTQSVDQSIFPSNQTDSVRFLCIGDSMQVLHMGGNLGGDPQALTEPGFSYIFYRCAPGAAFNGEDLPTILADPCHYLPAPAPQLVTVIPGNSIIDRLGNATFFNDGSLQALPENNGDPTSIWFAPFTADLFEFPVPPATTGDVGTEGSCINVNTDDAFNVIYLNEITITNLDNNFGGNGCQGQMTLSGGISEYHDLIGGVPVDDYIVNISKVGDPSVTAFVLGGWEHGETNLFQVPEPGTYLIEIEDGVSCGASATVVMGSCTPTDFSFGDSLALMGQNICMPIVIDNFSNIVSFQFFLEWDPSILTYTGYTAGDLDDTFLNITNNQPAPGSAFVLWTEPAFGGSPVTVPDGAVAFNVCFDVIGTPGNTSPVGIGNDQFEIAIGDGLNGSTQTDNGSVTVFLPSNMTLSFTSCASLSSAATDVGSFGITATGGTPPFTYAYIENGNPGNNGMGNFTGINMTEVTGLPPGTYTVTVTDATGGTQIGMVTIADASPLVIAIANSGNPTCDGVMDGFVTINTAGGIGPVNIEWETGQMNINTLNNLGSGNYTVSATDANGCVKTAGQGLITPDPITIDTVIQHVSCNAGPSDGSITVVPMGGPATATGFSFIWDNGLGTNATVNGLPAGIYCVTVTADVTPPGTSCSEQFCIEVNAPMPPVINGFTDVPISCPGVNDGEITVDFTLGNGNLVDIQWSNGMDGSTITGLGPNTYTVTITADDGCTATDMYILQDADGLVVTLDSIPPTCSYTDNGRVTATVMGGTGTYNYNWSTGATSSLIFDLACGQFYTVTVSDGGACPDVVDSIFLPCPPNILITFDLNTVVPVSCSDFQQPQCDGGVTVTASSGTTMSGDYNFQWDNSPDIQTGGSIHTATQLCAGWNYITVSDSDCFFVDSINIPSPPDLISNPDSTEITPVSCNGGMDGSIFVAGAGGTPPYQYNWLGLGTGQMVTGLIADSYFVTITDLNGCTQDVQLQVDEPDPLVAAINPDNTADATCNGSEDGQIEVIWTGGNIGPPTTYTWSPSVSTSSVATDLAPGLYTITVTDRKGCEDEVSHVIANPPPINFTLDPIVEPPCFGETTVITVAAASGGSGLPYQFSVGGAKREIDQAIRVLAGEITVTVFDADNCSEDTTITVGQPPEVRVDLGPELVEIDLGAVTEIDANIFPPGLQLESLVWTPNTNLECLDFIGNDTTLCTEVAASPLNTTIYTLTATDVNGCEGSSSITVDVDKNRNIFIPNAFSPNADGFNDEFRVLGGVGVEQIDFMRVFDRWGELLYEATNFQPTEGSDQFWNGRFKGKQLNPGVYVYLIRVSFIDGAELLYRGDITIIY